MLELLPFGIGAWLFISAYLCSLLLIGWIGYRARRENTLQDFYLAGSGFGLFVLFLTLYATQYSGNSFFGFTGMTYRIGFAWIMSVQFMLAIIVFYLVFAIPLHTLAHGRGYVTPVDYLNDRFGSKAINLIAAVIMILALSNFLLAQLMAMGRAMQGLAGAHGDVAYNYGVVVLALIMVIYGTLGGIRAVAWTDVIQGGVLMIGFLLLFFMLGHKFGPLSLATGKIITSTDIGISSKMALPDANRLREWLSYILIIGMGGALYPQAIQRIYAAKSRIILRRSLALMAFLPYLTVLIAVITGIYAIAYIHGLEGAGADQVLTRLFRLVQEDSVTGYWLVVVLFAAALSAMMSTADSALLSISSMLTKDIYAAFINKDATQARMTRIGKLCSWLLIVILVCLAILLKERASLIKLLDRKFDILVQLAPAFMLGIRWLPMRALPTLTGLIAGLIVSLTLVFTVGGKVWGFHPGLYGLVVNITIAVAGSLYINKNNHGGHGEKYD